MFIACIIVSFKNVDCAVICLLVYLRLELFFVMKKENYCLLFSKGMHDHFCPMAIELYAASMGFQALFHAGFHSYNIILEMEAQVMIQDFCSMKIQIYRWKVF